MPFMRIVLGIEYNGAAYCGWQSQANGCGVQDHVESALTAFLAGDAAVSVVCAGRTDTGVHALSQVVHFDTGIERDEIAWVRGTNAHLPDSIRVLWSRQVSEEFHARFSARSRSYRYLLLNDNVNAGILRGQVGWFHPPLQLETMRDVMQSLLGEHDFSAFRAAECQAKTAVKTMYEVDLQRHGKLLVFDFRANAFLHHMIRNLVGGLVYVGAGRHTGEDFRRIFASRNRTLAAPTFAADGLYLADIEYDATFALPEVRGRFPIAFSH